MLTAVHRGFFRQRYELSWGGQPLSELTLNMGENSAFTVNGQGYVISKVNSSAFVLHGPAGQFADGRLLNWRHWTIGSVAGQFELVKPARLSERWELHHLGQPIGWLTRHGAVNNRVNYQVPPNLPPELGVFSMYLVIALWRRAQSSAL